MVVGLTGGIATGKSTVARRLRDRGVLVIDADQVAREVVLPGTEGFRAVAERFPEVVVDGALDRAALRRRIVGDVAAKRDLEAITHPRIFASMAEKLQAARDAGVPVAVVEAALMVETGSYRLYDALIVVTCAPERQLRRTIARDGVSEGDARAMLAAQLPLAEKERVATYIIRNDDDEAALDAEVARVWALVEGRLSTGRAL
jgi:dephospho-CoA kinase